MKINFRCLITLIAFLAISLSLTATAQMRSGAYTVSPSIGGYSFESDQDIDNGITYGLGLGYNITENWGLEGTFNFVDTDSESTGEDVTAKLYRLDGLYNFMPDSKLVPYVAAGFSAIDIDRDGGTDKTDPMFNYGVGIKYFITKMIAVRGDVRHLISDDSDHNLLYTAGLLFQFGGQEKKEVVPPADTDGDGVYDEMDKCPNTPRGVAVDKDGCPLDSDGDGVYDYLDKCPDTPRGVKVDRDGCPPATEKDTDGDGVYDSMDKCPDTPTGVVVDKDGCPQDSDGDGVYDYLDKCPGTPPGVKVDKDGCPKDTDGDGVYDEMDKCPGTPEGVKVDKDGCPLDSDGDGVYDYLDKCPDTPKGAKVDENGCPLRVKEKVSIELKVEFDTDSAKIKERYKEEIKKVATFLTEYPGAEAVIEGHTDNVGDDKYNMKLSEKRANSVRDYILNTFNIDPARLTAKGYGETMPVADNATKAGRQKNRRVVAVIAAEK